MLELYEQNRVPPSQTSEAEGSAEAGVGHRPSSRVPTGNEENATNSSNAQGGGTTSKPGGPLKPPPSRPVPDHSYADNHGGPSKTTQSWNNDYGSSEIKSISDHKGDGEVVNQHHVSEESLYEENAEQVQNRSRFGLEGHEEDQERQSGRNETREAGELKDKYHHGYKDGTLGQSPQEAIKKIDKDKVKAALEKRRKSRGDVARKTDLMDEDDLIERELEDGIELPAEREKTKQERRQSWSKSSNWPDHEKHQDDAGDGHHQRAKGQSGRDFENVEEGELAGFDDAGHGYRSPKSNNRKRKAGSPPHRSMEGKQRSDYVPGSHHHNHHEFPEDRNRLARLGYPDRDQKRHVQENHV
ncbi:cyclin family protein [Actinidia rufa]|uniref:Cyclin family protein n=1 Tax=Actinidia rufa TaxID=165716 RepID=A0A7J0DI05_9ERIC|nr:cyclin family protein [Actinidia rufa]